MGEMVDRVAKALHEKMCDEDVKGYLGSDLDLAKAAIEALRNANLIYAVLEPRTEADEIAGRREFYGDSGAWLSLWNSALDEALKE